MTKKEILPKLKALQVIRKDGPLFKSADDCMRWIDNVAPLLKYDQQHYYEFCEHAKIVRITNLSAQTLMPHLNAMIGIVNQAIIELENGIEPIKENLTEEPTPTPTPTPTSTSAHKITAEKKNWQHSPLYYIAVGVIIFILGAFLAHLIKKHFGIPL